MHNLNHLEQEELKRLTFNPFGNIIFESSKEGNQEMVQLSNGKFVRFVLEGEQIFVTNISTLLCG